MVARIAIPKIVSCVFLGMAILIAFDASAGLAQTKATEPGREISVGVQQYPPMIFIDENGKVAGLAADILRGVAARNNWHLTLVPGKFADFLGMLERGEIDLLPGIARTEERAARFRFTDEGIISNWGVVYRNADVDIDGLLDLDGRRVAVVEQDIHGAALITLSRKFGIEIVPVNFATYSDAIRATADGNADAAVVSRLFGLDQVFEGTVPTTIVLNPVDVRFAARRDIPSGITEAVDTYLRDLKADEGSAYQQTVRRWFDKELEQKIPEWFVQGAVTLAVLLIVAVAGNLFLRHQVRNRTREIEAAKNRFERIFEADSDGLAVMSLDGRVQLANSATQEFFGRPRDELVGTCTPELAATAGDAEIDLVRADGTSVPLEIRAVDFEWEGSPALLVSLRDLGDRKKAEIEIRSSAERFRAVFEGSMDGIVLGDPDTGQISTPNPRMCEMLGYTAEELSRLRMADLFPPEDVAEITREFEAVAGGEQVVAFEVRLQRKDGKLLNAETSGRHIEIGGQSYVLGIFRDITGRKNTEEQLRQSQKMEAVGQLTGGVAHDFNNILAVILGNLELLKPDFRKDDEIDDLVEAALQAVLRGSDLTKQLLAFSRRQELQPRVLNVNDLVAGMDKLMRRTLGENIEIDTALNPALGLIKADPAQLESAILNLAINARDAMPAGGKLLIETSNVELDLDYVKVNPYARVGPHVCISVFDTGVGISEENMERIFEPFFTTKEIGKGTGLGLSMVFGFVKQSGGHINAYSELGHGTRFRIYLPRTDETGATGFANSFPEKPVNGTETILVVEDDEKVRNVVTLQLKKLGYRAVVAHDAASAIKILESDQAPDLLLTDMIMPGGMTGHELAERAKSMHPGMGILLTSGYPRDAFREGRKYHLISKPYSLDALSKAIRQVLSEA